MTIEELEKRISETEKSLENCMLFPEKFSKIHIQFFTEKLEEEEELLQLKKEREAEKVRCCKYCISAMCQNRIERKGLG